MMSCMGSFMALKLLVNWVGSLHQLYNAVDLYYHLIYKIVNLRRYTSVLVM